MAASSHRIPKDGEVDFRFATPEGFEESWVLQIADINKPLGAAASRDDQGCRGGL